MLAALIDNFNAVAVPVAAIVLNALWQGALLVGAVWLFVRSWPQLNASTRYAIWSATLAAVVIVPIATTLPFFTFTAAMQPAASTTSSSPETSAKAQRVVRAPMVTHALTTPVKQAEVPAQSAAQPAALPPRFRVTFPLPLAIGVFAIWIALALLALVRLAIGLMRLEQLKRDALPLPVEYRDSMERWTRANKGSREVRLCVSDETDVPVAVGLFDSMILIPRSLLERLSAPEVDQISLHELAHLRRGDDWSNGFQRVALALLAWNPAALFVSQQLDLEREVACDDWVLGMTGTVRPYALCLTKMAETSTWPRQPMPAPGVFATRKHISLRIERLLGAGRNIATTLALGPTALAVAVVATLSLAIAAIAPSVAAPCLQALAPVQPQPPQVASIHAAPTKIEKIIVYRSAPPAPVVPNVPAASNAVHVPAIDVHVPPTNVHVPATDLHMPATALHVSSVDVHVPEVNVTIPHVDVHSIVQNTLKGMPMHGMVAQAAVQECSGCNYSGANWAGKDLRGRNFTGVDLSRANLAGTDFSTGHFSGVDFSHANLHGASFRNASLVGCDFSDADLTNVDFTGAKLSGCQFTSARMNSSELRAVLDTCTGCDFTNADLRGADLSHIKTNGIDFTRANLSGANLSGSEFTGTDFTAAKFDGANLAGTTFNGCDFSGADLSHVDLSKTKMIGSDFSDHERESPKP
ncbi:MAG TPA: pentapeptide repeat-containing protein [Candidatus Baltobacteraceae bacterium]|nr:pentapeptide repeat-containing protein [Candidatus Baltobacteraceae bacterium]